MKYLSILTVITVALACAPQEMEIEERIIEPEYETAVSMVNPVGDSGVTGIVNFTAVENGVQVTAELSGLEPGEHGFHIHTYGDCTAPDGTSAGGHFNPGENEHSNPEAANRHMGDMGNITADADGEATIDYVDSTIEIGMIIGRGIIVHAGQDDLTSQPSGAAGARIACGVIGITE